MSGGKILLSGSIDLDFDNMAKAFGAALTAARGAHGNMLNFYPDDHQGTKLGIATNDGHCKKIITSYVMRHMTPDEIKARGEYTNAAGEKKNEILEWLSAIHVHAQ